MLRLFRWFLLFYFITGCGSGVPNPVVTATSFEDHIYPCIKFDIGIPIQLESTEKYIENKVDTIQYNLLIPSKSYYKLKVIKRYSASENEGWYLEPISEMYGENVTVYKINGYGFSSKSAIVALVEVNGDLYLRATVGDSENLNDMYMIIAERVIQKEKFKNLFVFESWKGSAAGKKIIQETIDLTNNLYDNTELTSCRSAIRPDEGIK